MIEREALAHLVGSWGPVLDVAPLHGDGSSRCFYRVWGATGTRVLLVGPDPDENAATVRVARHLGNRGVRVPRVHAVDAARGWILLDDLGDRNLWTARQQCRGLDEVLELYGPVLELLVRMQVRGARGFDLAVGFAWAPYGRETMIEAEGLYFAAEFAGGVLGLEVPAGFLSDLARLADIAAAAPAVYFLHRDFQSRNIQMTEAGPYVIDFQGARPGPLAYDAAALILDPYVGHSQAARARLLSDYLRRLEEEGVDSGPVSRSWLALGTFRLLQALGAYGKLGGRLGKPGFLEHAGCALDLLVEHLGEWGAAEWPSLWAVATQARDRWRRRSAGLRSPAAGGNARAPGA
ncbi:MAG: phosphotransferase [Deltaproteobacteria bacterium]|nr:phosphotransferase [Deltaproteobacteria bacterium]